MGTKIWKRDGGCYCGYEKPCPVVHRPWGLVVDEWARIWHLMLKENPESSKQSLGHFG